jgi:hypothetical protein
MFGMFRKVVVCLAALALPLQGLASAAMLHCGPSQERLHAGHVVSAPPSGGVGLNTGQGVSHDHHHPGDPAHHHAAMLPGAQAADHATASASAEPASDAGPHSCSACATCCSVCALPNGLLSMPAGDAAPARFDADVPCVAAFATGGPDRPPRPHLA